jgi:hypothetical protein
MIDAVSNFAEADTRQSRPFQAVFWGGLIVGVLDMAYAIVMYTPRQPILIPQTIASGVLGAKAYNEGISSAAFGQATLPHACSRTPRGICRALVFRGTADRAFRPTIRTTMISGA